jgi:hypothetical protein
MGNSAIEMYINKSHNHSFLIFWHDLIYYTIATLRPSKSTKQTLREIFVRAKGSKLFDVD